MFAFETPQKEMQVLKLLKKESNVGDYSMEVSSVGGGFSKNSLRYKFTGIDYSNRLFDDADLKFEELGELYNGEQRVCIRGFVPFQESGAKYADESNLDPRTKNNFSHSELISNEIKLRVLKNKYNDDLSLENIILNAKKRGYNIDYFFRSPHINSIGVKRDGYVLLVSKNGNNRPELSANEVRKEITMDKLRRKKLSNEFFRLPDGYKSIDNSSNLSLSKSQLMQLTIQWKKVFNPAYDFEVVRQIAVDQNTPKMFILDKNENLVGAVIAELDPFGNFEITELFCSADKENIKSITKFMISGITDEIKMKYPQNRIYMEANSTSLVPYIGYELGYIPASDIKNNVPYLLEQDITKLSKFNDYGVIRSNVPIGSEEGYKFKNFLFLQLPLNTKSYSPTNFDPLLLI